MESVMQEFIERTEIIFSELGYDVFDREHNEDMFQASFGKNGKFDGSFFIEKESNFIEFAYTYTFDNDEERFLRDHLESMLDICYEYGCYFNILKADGEIHFSVFTKIYFSGFNLESLSDTLEDFTACIQELAITFDLEEEEEEENRHLDSEDGFGL
jgi:hypothetical protein